MLLLGVDSKEQAMPVDSLRPLRADQFDYWKAHHLLGRAGFGGTTSQVRALANLDLERAVAYVVDYTEIDEPAVAGDEFDADLMQPPTREDRQQLRRARELGDEAVVAQFRRRRQARQRADRGQIREVQRWWLKRMIETPRPLEEKMTLFWHGHFATNYRAIEDSYHMFLQNQLFRYHAVGNFKTLVHGIIRDPAMLRYLNNNQNRKERPNENLARELMELFTLGEGNGYTERDIKEGARALTGYTYYDDEFIDLRSRQYERLHDPGPKNIFGKIGPWNGDDFADIIFTLDYASEFICWKLYRFFVNDQPGLPDEASRRFILKLARLLRSNDYHLKPVLRTLFMSEHFYDPANVASLIKSPIQLIVSAIRSLRTPVRNRGALLSAAALMGQDILYPPSVKGWDGGRAWINTSTLFVRQNLMVYLLTGRRPDTYAWEAEGSIYDAAHLIEHLRTPDGTIDLQDAVTYLLRFNLGSDPHPQRVEALVKFTKDHGGRLDNNMLIALLSLITAMPEYQLC